MTDTLTDVLNGPVVANDQGGKQSDSPYFLRGLPPLAVLRIARILKDGAGKYEADPFGDVTRRNWHLISSADHLEHVLMHAVALLSGDESADHAGHLATRALFFLHQHIAEKGLTP
jgi:hypothetical protein